MAIALIFGMQAVDLRTYLSAGHYDARSCLSLVTKELYVTLREIVGQPPSEDRPLVWNDYEQPLEEHISRIATDISTGGRLLEVWQSIMGA